MLQNNSVHLPGLNGLRAIAALSVMWGHVFQPVFGNWGVKGFFLPLVSDGVTLFFVISGFLITYLLLNEQEQTKTISISKFYLRRILRIWPIYYAYLIVALMVSGKWNASALWYYVFFGANIPFILSIGIIPIVHYWSLGVEEQFYLFWPWLVKKFSGKINRLLYIAFVICGGWMICKWGTYMFLGKGLLYRFFAVTRIDCMMIGAIGAILYFSANKMFLRFLGNRWIGAICLLLVTFSQLWACFIPSTLRPQVLALFSLGAIMSQLVEHPVVNLENHVCDYVGKISYGIYVIHPLLIILLSSLYRQHVPQMATVWGATLIYLIVTIVSLLIAALSYRCFEQPFLRMKDKFTIVRSQNSMQRYDKIVKH